VVENGRTGAPFLLPEHKALRELRLALSRGDLPRPARRTSADWARVATFSTIAELLRFLDEFKRRVEGGEPCRLVEIKQPQQPGRLRIEIVIESMSAAPP
jgi:hypothetical protein